VQYQAKVSNSGSSAVNVNGLVKDESMEEEVRIHTVMLSRNDGWEGGLCSRRQADIAIVRHGRLERQRGKTATRQQGKEVGVLGPRLHFQRRERRLLLDNHLVSIGCSEIANSSQAHAPIGDSGPDSKVDKSAWSKMDMSPRSSGREHAHSLLLVAQTTT
jgi:hypothetical protein